MSRDAAAGRRVSRRDSAGARVERTSFIGRERELALVRRTLVRGARLVTVLGPPGVGKTRLIRRYVSLDETAADFPGGIRFVDLSSARTLADVLRIVAEPRDRAVQPAEDEIARIGTALAVRGASLVVLDNLEQLTSLVPQFLPVWMDAAPETRWLITSRQRLGIAGESLLELAGLSDGEARSLFLDRVRSIAADYSMREAERPLLTRLVRRLDRLPLCIELAAARGRDLSVGQLHDALSRRFDLLRGGPRGVDERQGSLRAALDWSWELLDAVEREALAQCSVFSGSFTLGAAESVFELRRHGAPWALDVIQTLRDKSLLYAAPSEHLPDETRYALYESVREYASERLDQSGERAAVEARFAGFYAAAGASWSRAMYGREAGRVVSRIQAETDNLFAAYRAVRVSDPLIAARVALGMNAVLHTRGPLDASAQVLDEAVILAERGADQPLLVELLCATGAARYVRGRYREARADFERALEIAVAIGSPRLQWEAHRGIGPSARATGDYDRAQASGERALELGLALGDRQLEGIAQFNLGGVLMARGRNEEALVALEAALGIAREVGAPRPIALTLTNIGRTLDACGRVDEAAESFRVAQSLAEKLGDRVTMGKLMAFRAPQSIARGRFDEADELITRALEIAREVGDREIDATARMHRGRLAWKRGDFALARVSLSDALATARRLEAAWLVEQAGELLAQLGREDPASAITRGESAESLTTEPSGYWFQLGSGERADLSRRPSLRRILARLVEARSTAPGTALPVRTMLEAGWPGERMRPESGAERVYTAVRTLRRLGLGKVLLSRDGGYLLDPKRPIAR